MSTVTPSPLGTPAAALLAGAAGPGATSTGSSPGGTSGGAAFGSALAALLGTTPGAPTAGSAPDSLAPGPDQGAVGVVGDAGIGVPAPTDGTQPLEAVDRSGAADEKDVTDTSDTSDPSDAATVDLQTDAGLGGSLSVTPAAVVAPSPVVPPHRPHAGSAPEATPPYAMSTVASGGTTRSGVEGSAAQAPAPGPLAGPSAAPTATGTASAGPAQPGSSANATVPQPVPSNDAGDAPAALRAVTNASTTTLRQQPAAAILATTDDEATSGVEGALATASVRAPAPGAAVAAAEAGVTGVVGVHSALAAFAPAAAAEAAGATPTAVPSSTDPRAFAGQLARPVATLAAAGPGQHVVTVRVSPEHLGPLTVQAHVGPDGVRIELFSATEAGRAAVHAALPDLRRDLAGTGLGASLELSGRGAPAHEGFTHHGGQHRAGQQGDGDATTTARVPAERARADPALPAVRTPQPAQSHARLDVLV